MKGFKDMIEVALAMVAIMSWAKIGSVLVTEQPGKAERPRYTFAKSFCALEVPASSDAICLNHQQSCFC